MSQGYVYFFQSVDTRVKIGKTDDPHRRLRDLSHDGRRLTVIGVMQSTEPLAEEAAILRECAEHCVEGEWFNSAVLTKIEAYRHRFLKTLPAPKQVLIQSWVTPDLYEALVARAKSEGRSLSNFARQELTKILEKTKAQ